MRMLVVDDDPGSRAIVSRVARKALNVETDEASNGLECIDLLRQRQYALAVLDLQMPLVGGIEALQVIRSVPSLACLPVVVLTGGADEDHVRQAATLGVSDYLAKPINPDQLAARLLQVAGRLLSAGQSPEEPGGTAVLVLGPDPAARSRVAQSLSRDVSVHEADGDAELFAQLDQPHGSWVARVVVCSVDPEATPYDSLVGRIRATQDGPDIAVFAVVPREEVSAIKRTGLWDGVLSSAMPPTMLVSQFSRMVGAAIEARRAGNGDILAAG